MALGLQTETSGGGDFSQILKYDARAGRLFRVDRTRDDITGWETDNVEITQGFNAIFDLEQIEVGWALFANGVAPDFKMVPLGEPLPARPTDRHKQGFRLNVWLGKSLAHNGAGEVRELSSCAKAVISSMDALHSVYEASRAANPGKLPVVALTGATPIESQGKDAQGRLQKSVNYAPVFQIVRWVGRPQDMAGPDKAHASLPKTAPKQATREPGDDGEEFEAAPGPRKAGRMASAPITDDFDDEVPF